MQRRSRCTFFRKPNSILYYGIWIIDVYTHTYIYRIMLNIYIYIYTYIVEMYRMKIVRVYECMQMVVYMCNKQRFVLLASKLKEQ